MGQASSTDGTAQKNPLQTHPVNLDVTKQYGSGAEQDRFGQHFSEAGSRVGEKIREGIDNLGTRGSSGAEQDRYGARFGTGDVRDAARSGFEKASNTAERGYNQAKDAVERGYDQARGSVQQGYGEAKSAAQRGYGEAKNAAERGYDEAKSAAERGYDKARDAMDKAINAKGDGAEQDRYGAHFDYSSLDLKPVTRAALSIVAKAGDLSAASAHGLGHDGWERAKILAAYKGSGAEQDRYEARFGGFGKQAGQAIREKVNELRK